MDELDLLIEILEKSVKKNGDIELTNKHLLNILKMAKGQLEKVSDLNDARCDFDSENFGDR